MITALVILLGLVVLATYSWSEQSRTKLELEENRGWRVVFTQDGLRYEEKKNDVWHAVLFPREDFEPGVWYCRFPSDSQWHSAPEIFSGRRQEIITRVRVEFPDVSYANEIPVQSPDTPGKVI
mgnify:CR=1 FL=1